MIKVNKDITTPPLSLRVPFLEFFNQDDGIPIQAQTTHKRRIEVIDNNGYIEENKYNSRYKLEDVKLELNKVYNNKCAFCEQIVEQFQVEHYRPKKIYFWLAFSWDNLLLACQYCNQYKDINFELDGKKFIFDNTPDNIKNINSISVDHDTDEMPRMVNPEVTNPLNEIKFQKNGSIESADGRFSYTINVCRINRSYLNDSRRKLINIYERDIESALVDSKSIDEQKTQIQTIVKKFIRDSEDLELPFLGFRKYAIKEGWLNEIIKKIKS